MARRARVLDNLEREAVASLKPRQLRGMGLDAGDMVKVATRRGEIALKVRADGDVPEGMVLSPFSFTKPAPTIRTTRNPDPSARYRESKFYPSGSNPLKAPPAPEHEGVFSGLRRRGGAPEEH